VIRARRGHLLNPAAIGLLAASLLFSTEQSWWGGLGDLPGVLAVAVIAGGLLVAAKVNKLPGILAFCALYFGLFAAAAYLGHAVPVRYIFQQPFAGAALFFAFFMLTDPPTSPARDTDQLKFAAIVATGAFATYMFTSGGQYYLLVGLLAGNLFEAW